jgi:hypothetical protein
MMRVVLAAAAITGSLAGCATETPTASPPVSASTTASERASASAGAVEPPRLPPVGGVPQMTINGVAGSLVSYCWVDGCVDGVLPDPSRLEAVRPPFDVRMPEAGTIASVTAVGPDELAPDNRIEIGFEDSRIGDVPEGTVMLQIFLSLQPAGDAFFVWGVDS